MASHSKRLFYGWYMVAAASALQWLQAALITQSFGAYVAVLQAERGWSKTALSGAAALQQMEAALLGPVIGGFMDRFGPQGIIRAGVVIFGVGLMLLSRTETLGGFYGAFLIIALGGSLFGFFPMNVQLILWFERWRARALSSLSFGLALGGACVPLVAWSLQAFGWRATAFASGLLAIAAGLPLAFVMKRRPEDRGTTVDGLPPRREALGAAGAVAAARRDFTAREALRTPAFWLLSLGHGFALFVVHAVNVHAITHMTQDLHYTLKEASLAYMLLPLAQMGGVALGWLIGDRYEKRFIAAICMLMHMSALLLLTYAQNLGMVLAFAVLHGGAWGLRGPFMQAIRADYFGRTAIGMILGISLMILVIGQVGGPMIAGVLADLTGNYRLGFTLLSVLAGLGSLFFVLARRPERPAA
ncbi:MAG TPA: MFS transporter [Burkholderiales bacterium]|nr:MFS transporter [Burkholderiales bacterium]